MCHFLVRIGFFVNVCLPACVTEEGRVIVGNGILYEAFSCIQCKFGNAGGQANVHEKNKTVQKLDDLALSRGAWLPGKPAQERVVQMSVGFTSGTGEDPCKIATTLSKHPCVLAMLLRKGRVVLFVTAIALAPVCCLRLVLTLIPSF